MGGKESSSGSPLFKDMVMDAIVTQKERSGSSLSAIKNHLGSKYKVDVAKKAGILNRALKKMCDEGVLVAGAPPGRKGAGCCKEAQGPAEARCGQGCIESPKEGCQDECWEEGYQGCVSWEEGCQGCVCWEEDISQEVCSGCQETY